MNKKYVIVGCRMIVLVVAFSFSGVLVLYIDGRWLNFFESKQFNEIHTKISSFTMSWDYPEPPSLELLMDNVEEMLTRALPLKNLNSLAISTSSTSLESAPAVHGSDYSCVDAAATGIGERLVGGAYKWTDDQGGVHYSDTPSAKYESQLLLGRKQSDFFELRVSYPSGPVPKNIRETIEVGGKAIYQVYTHYLSKHNMSKSAIDVLVFGNKTAYQAYRKKIAPSLQSDSVGFYSWRDNKAAVLYDSSIAEAERTALHESTHVINAKNFGRMPKWFNEGMADVFSMTTVTGQYISIPPAFHRLRFLNSAAPRILLIDLLRSTTAQWVSEQRAGYYAYAWSLAFFLMQPRNQPLMKVFQQTMARDKCDVIDSADYFETNYPGGLQKLDRDWRSWQRSASGITLAF